MTESRYTEGLVIKSAAADHVTLSGYASVFNCVDSHNDVVLKGAFSKSPSSRNIKFLWQHDSTQPIGVVNSIREDDYGLYAEVTVNSQTQQGREAIALVGQGAINGLSIGFNIVEASFNTKGQREITSLDLWEISLVTFPANHQAQLSHTQKTWDEAARALDGSIKALSLLNQL